MKRIMFTSAVLLVGTFTFASSGIKILSKSIILDPTPCSITVPKNCKGADKSISTTSASPTGNCDQAYAAANQQWNADCKSETIKKIIKELEASTEE